jgi:hypothetical protein
MLIRNHFVFISLLLILMSVSGVALAQSAPMPCPPGSDPCASNCGMNQNMNNNFQNAAQTRTGAAQQALSGVHLVDTRIYACLASIDALFETNAAISNPMNILQGIFWKMIATIVNQVCQQVQSTIQNFMNVALSQFNRLCIPLPKLNFSFGLHKMTSPACNGVSLFNQHFTSPNSPVAPGEINIWSGVPASPPNPQ